MISLHRCLLLLNAIFLLALSSANADQTNVPTSTNFDYKDWWETWYKNGHNSGPGSRGILAQFKADVINDFINEKKIKSAVEFGCGDGYNLKMIKYGTYTGFDVSITSIKMCTELFKNDSSKKFMLYDPNCFRNNAFGNVDLVVCLDVLYHVIDEKDYVKTLDDIFSFSSPYIILYTSLYDLDYSQNSPEMRHRDVLSYLKKYTDYEITIKKQKYPTLSGADFIFLVKKPLALIK